MECDCSLRYVLSTKERDGDKNNIRYGDIFLTKFISPSQGQTYITI